MMYKNRASVMTRITALYVDKIANKVFEDIGLSLAQYKILAYLFSHSEADVTTASLEEHFQMSHSTSVGLLNNLEKDGWIKREKTVSSGRSKVICASQKAESHRDAIRAKGEELEQVFTSNLTREETEQYILLSKKILGTTD